MAQANRFRRDSKIEEATFVRLVYFFCNGVPVDIAARSTNLSAKTVRAVYIGLRPRLRKPEFNRWSGAHIRLLKLPTADHELIVRGIYYDVLATCALNENCARNYRLGNRKNRQCRTCPLSGKLSEEAYKDGYTIIDTIYHFYRTLGIRSEKERDPAELFRERLIHTISIATAQNHSRKLANGLFDPGERAFLSGGSLFDVLLEDLSAEPL